MLLVVLGFDVETDVGSWTPYYRGVAEGTPRLLDLLSPHAVQATFCSTGHAARTHPEGAQAAAGHEVGCHSLYHETVEDELSPIPLASPLLPEEVPFRLRVATEWVAEAAGRPAVLCLYRHPRESVPGPQGAVHYGEGAVTPDAVLAGLADRGASFLSARELARCWDGASAPGGGTEPLSRASC